MELASINNKVDWTKEQRQAPVGLILFSVDVFRKLIKGLWPFVLIAFFNTGNEKRAELYFWLILVGIAFIVVNAVLTYWFYKFQIVNDEFVVKKGYLKKIKLSVPLDRIQTINIKQNIIQKVLKVVSLEIETAGTQDSEIELIAIKEATAEALKKIFQAKIKQKSGTEDFPKKTKSLILSLDFVDLIKVALSENHIRSFFIVTGVLMGLYYQVKDVFEEEANRLAEESYQTLESMSYELYFWLFIFILIFSVFISFSRILLRFYNFKLTKTEAAFKIRFGLLNTKELSVPLSKIQLISWHKNPLRNWLNYQTLKIKQASSTERIKKLPSIEIPACKWSHREIIERELFGTQEILFSNQYKTHSLYFLRSFLVASILFLLPSIGFLWHEFYYWIAFIVFELFMLVMLILAYQKRYFRISESQIEISKGKVAQTIYRLPNFKIQSLAFEQNIFTKKRALASIVIYTASGENLTIPYISEKLALDLYNFLLYKIESTEQNWM